MPLLYDCITLVIPTEMLEFDSLTSYTKELPDIPNYTNFAPMESQNPEWETLSPTEAQSFCDLVSHFFFSKLETSIGEAIKERLDVLNKPKPNITATINKRQLLELNIPSKLKKSFMKIAQSCLEAMKKRKDDWFTCPTCKTSKKLFPQILDYRDKYLKNEFNQENFIENLEQFDDTKQILSNFCKVLNLEELGVSQDLLELMHNLLVNSLDNDRGLFLEYIWLGGEEVERERLKNFYQGMLSLKRSMNTDDILRERSAGEVFLNTNGISILMTLFVYFYDQENSGKLQSEACPIPPDSFERLTSLVQQLKLYEQVARISIACNGLMESPIWFFYNQLALIRVTSS